jgi:hypothetical protein
VGGTPGLTRSLRGAAVQRIPLMEGLRACRIGLALVGMGAAWVWPLPGLLGLSLAIDAGGSCETLLILFALQYGADLACGQSRAGDRTHPMPVRGASTA